MSKKQKKAARATLLSAQQQGGGGGGGGGKKKKERGCGGGGAKDLELSLNPDDHDGEWVDVGTVVRLSLTVARKKQASFGFKVKMEDRLLVSAVIPNGPAEKVMSQRARADRVDRARPCVGDRGCFKESAGWGAGGCGKHRCVLGTGRHRPGNCSRADTRMN